MLGSLDTRPALTSPELLAGPVHAALTALGDEASVVHVAPIDPTLADTAAFCAAYAVPLELSANCVVVAGRRGEDVRHAACVVLATTRADVNGVVRRRLDARKASFAPMEDAVRATGMEYGGITPVGLPPPWPVLVDAAVTAREWVVVGSGIRGSKLVVPGGWLARLPGAEAVDGLARAVSPD